MSDVVKPPPEVFKPGQNFGDNLNNWIFYHYTGKVTFRRQPWLMVGSILGRFGNDKVIWGSGFGSAKEKCVPKRVSAVRGKLTRKRLLELGIQCPEVYGDPALLLPEIYFPKPDKQYEFAWIPHKRDKRSPEFAHRIHPKEHLPPAYLKDMLRCEYVISSSLHGCIVADAYGLPNAWIYFDDDGLKESEYFKYKDYYSAVDLEAKSCPLDLNEIRRRLSVKPKPDLELLKSVIPFGNRDDLRISK